MEDTWFTLGGPVVKETMYGMASRILEEIDQWRENSSTDDTLNSLTSIETFLEEIKEMNFAILREIKEMKFAILTGQQGGPDLWVGSS